MAAVFLNNKKDNCQILDLTVANEWLSRLNDHSKVLQEKILLKI